MDDISAYRFTGLVVLILGVLFFLRDLGLNVIGDTSGWAIVFILVGSAILAGKPIIKKGAKLIDMPMKIRGKKKV